MDKLRERHRGSGQYIPITTCTKRPISDDVDGKGGGGVGAVNGSQHFTGQYLSLSLYLSGWPDY